MMLNDKYGLSRMQAKSIIILMPCYANGMKTGKPTKSEQTDFAERLCRLRETAGFSQRTIAQQMGISQPAYANWETHNVSLKPEQLVRLAEVLGVDVAELLTTPKAKRRSSPTGKMRQLFEAASNLSRSQQQKVVDVLQPFVTQHSG